MSQFAALMNETKRVCGNLADSGARAHRGNREVRLLSVLSELPGKPIRPGRDIEKDTYRGCRVYYLSSPALQLTLSWRRPLGDTSSPLEMPLQCIAPAERRQASADAQRALVLIRDACAFDPVFGGAFNGHADAYVGAPDGMLVAPHAGRMCAGGARGGIHVCGAAVVLKRGGCACATQSCERGEYKQCAGAQSCLGLLVGATHHGWQTIRSRCTDSEDWGMRPFSKNTCQS